MKPGRKCFRRLQHLGEPPGPGGRNRAVGIVLTEGKKLPLGIKIVNALVSGLVVLNGLDDARFSLKAEDFVYRQRIQARFRRQTVLHIGLGDDFSGDVLVGPLSVGEVIVVLHGFLQLPDGFPAVEPGLVPA